MSYNIKGIDALPDKIKKHILGETSSNYNPPNNRIWVTNIICCLRKAWFRRKFPKRRELQKSWHLYRGNVFHDKWEGLYQDDDKKIDIPLWNSGAILVAKYDFFDEGCIWEMKWVTDAYKDMLDKKGASKEHEKQLQIYLHTWNIEMGKLIYLMSKEVVIVDVPYDDEFDLNELLQRALILFQALEDNTPPPTSTKMAGYECGYCEYKDECIKWKNEGRL